MNREKLEARIEELDAHLAQGQKKIGEIRQAAQIVEATIRELQGRRAEAQKWLEQCEPDDDAPVAEPAEA